MNLTEDDKVYCDTQAIQRKSQLQVLINFPREWKCIGAFMYIFPLHGFGATAH